MNHEPLAGSNNAWEAEGRRSAALVQNLSVVLVAGTDAVATAHVALGIAREESARRAVTVADIWGDLPEIERLTSNEDPHGISDHLTFGVSLARLRTPVEGNPTLQLIKSGTDDIARESLLLASRWDSIFASFRNVGALLVLPCHTGTPGLEHLSQRADGVITVGDAQAASLAGIVGNVNLTAPRARERARAPRVTPVPNITTVGKGAESSLWRSVQRWPVAMVLALATIGAITLLLSQSQRIARIMGKPAPENTPVTTPVSAPPPAAILNPQDAPEAARYAVEIAVLNTRAGADMRLAELREIPGSTISHVVNTDGESWFRVFAGAFRTRESADSLQGELRSRAIPMADGDRVKELPLALRLAIHPPNAEAAAASDLARYISLGIPAYLLAQTDGSLIIYAGGFERLEDASHFGELCARKGIPSRLVYRTGR